MLFKYKGIDSKGKFVKAKIEANTIEEAKSKLKSRKTLYTDISKDNMEFFSNINFTRKSKLDNSTLSYVSRDLSIYLKAGISLVQSIKLLGQRYEKDKKFHSFFQALSTSLDEGKTFHTALENQNILILPEFYIQSIKVSENGGLLQSVLHELALFLKEQDRIKKQMSSAMAYPLFILMVSVLMVGFMLSVIVPKITSIFTKTDNELPAITSFVINLGDFFANNFMYIILLFVVTIITFTFFMGKSKEFKYFVHSSVLKIPFINNLIELNELSRFSYMNSILIRSGVPVVQSIKLSSDILNNAVIKALFVQASNKVVEGERLSKILSDSKIYKIETSFVHAIAIGEETSELSAILNSLALLYNESNKDKITIFLAILEPALMLVVGSIIGFIVVAMLLPIFSMNLG